MVKFDLKERCNISYLKKYIDNLKDCQEIIV